MTQFGFAIDNRVCIGCHACTVACKSEHSVPIGVNRTWVKYIEKGTFPDARRSFNVQRCNHCADAPCVEICPVTSLYTRPDGIVDFDSDRCIGCKACMQACPYDALYLDPETNTAAKCNYCTHRVDNGYEPACVVVCPVEAIVSGDLSDPTSRISLLDRTQPVQYPKIEKNTRPKLFYVGGETAALNPTEAPPEIDYLWSGVKVNVPKTALESAAREAEAHAKTNGRARRVYDTNPNPAPWGWMVSAYVTTKAIAAGTMLIAFLLYTLGRSQTVLPTAPAIYAILFLAVTGVLLVADLKQPWRFHYIMLRPQWRSWLVRGAYAILAYSIMLPASWIVSALDASTAVQQVIGGITAALAALVAAYTAFLFAQARGRDYWQNPLLAIVMLADAAVAGIAVLAVIGAIQWRGGLSADDANAWLQVGVGSLAVLLAAEFLTGHPSRNAALTTSMILRGPYRLWFWLGTVVVGIVAPMIVLWFGTGNTLPAALVILGIAAKNHVTVQAPQRVPLS